MTRIWRVPRVERFICATARWSSHDRSARAPEHYL
jgi:hypothetical protein